MSKKRVLKPNVISGGRAIPLGANYYYMKGRKHKDGGIDVGANPKTGLEVEDEEVMHLTNSEVKVFSSVPFLNGKSPAEKLLGGENPTKVFNAQENYKDRKGLNDDGTKKGNTTNNKKQNGGRKKPTFDEYYKTVPKEKSDTTNFNLRRAYDLLPSSEMKRFASDKNYHLRSIAPNKDGDYEFLKSKDHDTYNKEIEWYNSNDGKDFRNNYDLDDTGKYPVYKSKTNMNNRNKKLIGGRKKAVTGTKRKAYDDIADAGLLGITSGNNKPFAPSTLPNVSINTNPNNVDFSFNQTRGEKFVDTVQGIGQTISKGIKSAGEYTKENPWVASDGIGLAANTIGSLIGNRANKKMLNSLEYSKEPVQRRATKLKTQININPQLDRMRETLANYERDIDNNTASSRVGLVRKQRGRLAGMLQTNELYGSKENIETELINKDRLNQQQVNNSNTDQYNRWSEGKTMFNNTIREKKSENTIGLIESLNSGVQDIISRGERRGATKQNALTMAAAHPNVNPRILKEMGVKGITSKMIADWDKAYNKRGTKTNNDNG